MQKIKSIFSFQNLDINIIRKKVKHLRMTVSPPHGDIKISAPLAVSNYTIREFIFAQLNWIKKQQLKFKNYEVQPQINYTSGETHYFFGNAYTLKIVETKSNKKNRVTIDEEFILFFIKPGSSSAKREKILYEWYRSELKKIIPDFIEKWQPIIGKEVLEWRIKRMKTRWGSCNIKVKRIWLNLELVKKSPQCIEYVLVHEMVHLLERYHNKNFYSFMDQFLPDWKIHRKQLNQN